MNTSRRIEIIGGGLAGLSLGIALRRHGIDTSITEAGTYPRHRVCGEFITGLPESTVERLQLGTILRDARPNRDVVWFAEGEVVRRQQLPSPALSVSRYVLDNRLASEFMAAGGELHTGRRTAAIADVPGRVFATGRRRANPTWLGLKLHARNLPLRGDLELHLGRHAYVGLVRVDADRVNICGLFRQQPLQGRGSALLLHYLRACKLDALARRIDAVAIDESSFSAVAALGFDARIPRQIELRLGDACAMIPPFTGHGMAMAFQSAEIALAPLLAYANHELDWPETRRRIQLELRRRFRLRLAAAGGLHSFLLVPRWQRWLAVLNRANLLPLQPLYSALH